MAYSEADKVLVNVLRQEMVVGEVIDEFTSKNSSLSSVKKLLMNSDQMELWVANPAVVKMYGADCSGRWFSWGAGVSQESAWDIHKTICTKTGISKTLVHMIVIYDCCKQICTSLSSQTAAEKISRTHYNPYGFS